MSTITGSTAGGRIDGLSPTDKAELLRHLFHLTAIIERLKGETGGLGVRYPWYNVMSIHLYAIDKLVRGLK